MLRATEYHLNNQKNVKNIPGGMLLLVTLLAHQCFLRFLNCKNGTKSRKVSRKGASPTNVLKSRDVFRTQSKIEDACYILFL